MEKLMGMDDELRVLKREQERFDFVAEDAKRYFGQWDMCDPVVWAILRVVGGTRARAARVPMNHRWRTGK